MHQDEVGACARRTARRQPCSKIFVPTHSSPSNEQDFLSFFELMEKLRPKLIPLLDKVGTWRTKTGAKLGIVLFQMIASKRSEWFWNEIPAGFVIHHRNVFVGP